MDFDDSAEDAEFRREFRDWLNAHHPGEIPSDPDAAFDFRRIWQRTMFDAW